MLNRKSKRSSGTCSINKRGNKYEVRFYAYDHQTGEILYKDDGKPIRKSKSFSTMREANDFIAEYQQKKLHHITLEDSSMLFSDYIYSWFDEYKRIGNKPRTVDSTLSIIRNHLVPMLGKYRLNQLSHSVIQNAFNERSKNYKGKTLNNIRSVLHNALKDATVSGLLVNNTAEDIKIPKIEKKKVQPLSADEIKLFLDACKDDTFEFLYYFDLNTGLRKGELLGLTWDAVDLDTGVIQINKQLSKSTYFKGSEYILDSTKTDSGNRKIVIAGEVLDRLRKWRRLQTEREELVGAEWNNEWNLVFTNDFGGPISPDTLIKHLRKIREKINRPDLTLHSLRHTYGTLLAEQGLPLATLKNLMGHSSIDVTIDVYGAVSTDPALFKAANMMADIMNTEVQKDDID